MLRKKNGMLRAQGTGYGLLRQQERGHGAGGGCRTRSRARARGWPRAREQECGASVVLCVQSVRLAGAQGVVLRAPRALRCPEGVLRVEDVRHAR